MHFKNVAIFAAAAAALPTERQIETPCPGDKFGLIAIHSGSPVQNTGISAAQGNLLIGGKNEASCDTKSDGFATFVLNDGDAYLYSTDNVCLNRRQTPLCSFEADMYYSRRNNSTSTVQEWVRARQAILPVLSLPQRMVKERAGQSVTRATWCLMAPHRRLARQRTAHTPSGSQTWRSQHIRKAALVLH